MALVYHFQTGLAVAAVFLSCNTLYFIFECAIPIVRTRFKDGKLPDWMIITQYLTIPLFIVLLGVILIPILFLGERNHTTVCQFQIEADIAGLGIRLAAWAQICVLLFVALLGTFHSRATMAKEIGAGLAVTHLSLAIALLIHKKDGKLTLADIILGSMMLDAQNSALSIPLVTKETLAARWQVAVTVVCQGLGLVLLGVIVHDFGDEKFIAGSCQCVSAAWWGDIGACPKPSTSSGSTAPSANDLSAIVRQEMKAFWIYYACRCISFVQSSFHSLANMNTFHEAEKNNKVPLDCLTFPQLVLDQRSKLKKRIFKGRSKNTTYNSYATTVSLAFLVYAMFAIASMTAAEKAMAQLDTIGEKKISFGQAVAIVVAAATILRGVWLLYKLLDNDGLKGFRWPLRNRG